MAVSPAVPMSKPTDVFEQLSVCPKLLTARELHDVLAISEKTVYKYVSFNLIPYYEIEANVRFRLQEILEWLRSCRSHRKETTSMASLMR